MRNLRLIMLAAVFTCCKSHKIPSYKEINVLFVGNSLTYFYDMPQTLQMMLNESHPHIKIDQITFPGQSLSGHLSEIITEQTENSISTRQKEADETTDTEIKIAETSWDIIILQTGTVSVLIPENRNLKVNQAIADIKKLVSNPKCKFILFNTWPSKNDYPIQYCYPSSTIDESIEKIKCCSPTIQNLEQELKLINESYELVAQDNDLLKTDNGTKFYEILTKHPEIDLYADTMHPNEYGAFLNACVFYQILTNRKASELNYIGTIAPETAHLLKQIAE